MAPRFAEMKAKPVTQAHRALEIDVLTNVPAANGGAVERLLAHVGFPPSAPVGLAPAHER